MRFIKASIVNNQHAVQYRIVIHMHAKCTITESNLAYLSRNVTYIHAVISIIYIIPADYRHIYVSVSTQVQYFPYNYTVHDMCVNN